MRKIKINQNIEADKVLLISSDGKQLGVFKFHDALQQAQKQELDLVLMSGESNPPVCKILDFKKRIFEKKKQIGSAKKNVKRTSVKEIKFRPDTEQGDYNVKTKRLIKFLDAGDRVKVTIRFRGREIVYKERGYEMLVRIEKHLSGIADIEQKSKLEGKLLTAVFKPIPKSSAKSSTKPSESPVANPSEKPSAKPIEPPVAKSSPKPTEPPVAKSPPKPTEPPAAKSSPKPSDSPAANSAEKS